MKIGTVRGIKIKLHFSTLIIVGLVGFYAVTLFLDLVPEASLVEILLVGIINGVIILFSILIHELAHSLVAQQYGLKVSEIELYLFGGVSKIEEEPRTPKSEMIISIVGPLSSLILGAIFLAVMLFNPLILPPWLFVTLLYSGISNIGLGIFNLIPAFPMDGGRVLRAYLWNRRNNLLSATRTASKLGRIIGYSMMALGFIQILFGQFGGFWLILMGLFLDKSARKSYVQAKNEVTLSKINVRDVVGWPEFAIPFDTLLNDAIRNYFIVFSQTYFPVVRGNDIVGIVHLDDIKRVPIEQRSEFIIGNIMKILSEFPFIYEEETGKDAMRKFNQMDHRPHVAIVKDNEKQRIVGFLDESDIVNAMKLELYSHGS